MIVNVIARIVYILFFQFFQFWLKEVLFPITDIWSMEHIFVLYGPVFIWIGLVCIMSLAFLYVYDKPRFYHQSKLYVCMMICKVAGITLLLTSFLPAFVVYGIKEMSISDLFIQQRDFLLQLSFLADLGLLQVLITLLFLVVAPFVLIRSISDISFIFEEPKIRAIYDWLLALISVFILSITIEALLGFNFIIKAFF